MRRRWVLALAVVAFAATSAWGHPMPNSTVIVQLKPGAVDLVAYMPITELKAATDDRPADQAGAYVLQHADVVGADGRPWGKQLGVVEADTRDGVAVMSVTVAFAPPPGAASHAVGLRYDAIIHRVASHFVLVYRRQGEALSPLMRLQSPVSELVLP